jgi:hypothetical protein
MVQFTAAAGLAWRRHFWRQRSNHWPTLARRGWGTRIANDLDRPAMPLLEITDGIDRPGFLDMSSLPGTIFIATLIISAVPTASLLIGAK